MEVCDRHSKTIDLVRGGVADSLDFYNAVFDILCLKYFKFG